MRRGLAREEGEGFGSDAVAALAGACVDVGSLRRERGKRFGDDGEGRGGCRGIKGREEIVANSVEGEGSWACSLG